MASSTSSCTSLLNLIFGIRRKSPLQNQWIIWEYMVRGWLPLWISGPKSQTEKKNSFPLLTLTTLKKFNNSPCLGNKQKQVYNEPTEAYLFLIKHITKQIKSKMHIRLHIKGVKLGTKKNWTRQRNNWTRQLKKLM